jgi:hypothetical protein
MPYIRLNNTFAALEYGIWHMALTYQAAVETANRPSNYGISMRMSTRTLHRQSQPVGFHESIADERVGRRKRPI